MRKADITQTTPTTLCSIWGVVWSRGSLTRVISRPTEMAQPAVNRAAVCRSLPLFPSCRITTKSETERSVRGSHNSQTCAPSAQLPQLFCLLLRRRCYLWAKNSEQKRHSFFFCDFGKDLAAAVTEGRRNEFGHFSQFSDAAERERIPDPNAGATFEACRLNWNCLTESPHKEWLEFHRGLLKLRSEHIVPRLYDACRIDARYGVNDHQGLSAHWKFADNSKLTLVANLGSNPISADTSFLKKIIYASDEVNKETLQQGTLPAWSVVWSLES